MSPEVAAISPALSEMEDNSCRLSSVWKETLGTLRFASSVKKAFARASSAVRHQVRTHAVSNEQDVGESDLLLQTMRSEVAL